MYRFGRPRRQRGLRPLLALLALGTLATAHPSAAQSAEPPGATLAMLNVAFYGKHATDPQPGDSLFALAATAAMRDQFRQAAGVALTDSAKTAAAEAAPLPVQAALGKPCNVIVACARAVGKELGVQWVVMAKVSKTSDIIWILSGQLIDVATGKLVYDDVYELKGVATDLVPRGAQVFARRITERVAPHPEP